MTTISLIIYIPGGHLEEGINVFLGRDYEQSSSKIDIAGQQRLCY